jgi:hypothetical protein
VKIGMIIDSAINHSDRNPSSVPTSVVRNVATHSLLKSIGAGRLNGPIWRNAYNLVIRGELGQSAQRHVECATIDQLQMMAIETAEPVHLLEMVLIWLARKLHDNWYLLIAFKSALLDGVKKEK